MGSATRPSRGALSVWWWMPSSSALISAHRPGDKVVQVECHHRGTAHRRPSHDLRPIRAPLKMLPPPLAPGMEQTPPSPRQGIAPADWQIAALPVGGRRGLHAALHAAGEHLQDLECRASYAAHCGKHHHFPKILSEQKVGRNLIIDIVDERKPAEKERASKEKCDTTRPRCYSRMTTITGPRRSVLGGRSCRPYFLDCEALSSAADSVLVVLTKNVS